MYCPVCGMVHVKDSLLLIERVAHEVTIYIYVCVCEREREKCFI